MKMKVGVYAQKHVDGTINYELKLSSLIRHALGVCMHTYIHVCVCVCCVCCIYTYP